MKKDKTGKTIRLSEETYDRLQRRAWATGFFTGRRVSIEETIIMLLDTYQEVLTDTLMEALDDDRN